MIFKNRQDAGKKLSAELLSYKDKNPIVLALPRGGVPIGFEVSKVLQAPLNILVVRKIAAPYKPEFGIGAIAEGNVLVLDEPTLKDQGISREELNVVIKKENEELKRRVLLYRKNKPFPKLTNKTVILVDDGLATGVTARAAISSIKKQGPKQIVFASPVCAFDVVAEFKHLVDAVICVRAPVDFEAVALWYQSFEQVSDREVIELLKLSGKEIAATHHAKLNTYGEFIADTDISVGVLTEKAKKVRKVFAHES